MHDMINQPYKSVVFEWLSETGEVIDGSDNHNFGESGWIDYQMPPDIGKGGYEVLELALGTSLVRSTFEFSQAALGAMLPLMNVDVKYNEPSFQAMALRGLRGSVKETYPPAHLACSPGIDLFRHTTQYCSSFTVDASFSGELCHVSIGRGTMDKLIGDQLAEALLENLDILRIPSISVKATPLHLSQHLFTGMTARLTGMARKLYCQAKILEYLAALVQHLGTNIDSAFETNQKSRKRSQAIHAQLMASEGKLPTLDQLADHYGRSAKLLNEEFADEFGKSIYLFMADYRLTQAHAALEHSEITIKQLAAKLGYSHVNNFMIAFKRKFGYPPGSLRRK
jgi:AraC-like DNA-binding protein